MRIACLGGGPGGLYFAISMKLRCPNNEVVVFERNRADDTFGWGVVLSAQTLDNLQQNDPTSAAEIHRHFAYWDDLAVVRDGERVVSGGHGFCGLGRKKMLLILQQRALELGVDLRFSTEVADIRQLATDYDVVVAADGLNSKTRSLFANEFKPLIDKRACKFVWYGTRQKFDDAFTFIFESTPKGYLWAHAYQFDEDTATFIVECSEQTWAAYGFGEMSQQESIEVCQQVFKDHLGGHPLMTNANHIRGSAWLNFPRVLCECWSHQNVVLLGDAAATAHFSIGSGTKLALESAIALADYLTNESTIAAAFEKYQSERRLQVLRIQSAALNSLEWFENIERYLGFDLIQFNYSQLTRSQRISHENLRERDAGWLQSAERWFQQRAGVPASAPLRAPLFAPLVLRDLRLENRVVAAPYAQYMAADGCPNDWHLTHYGERAKGGVGLVCTEMVAISPEARATLGCPGLYSTEQELEWRRITDFIHKFSAAKICCQLGHAGARASTQREWEAPNMPLEEGNWPLVSASSLPWSSTSLEPREMKMADMEEVKTQFVEATRRADRAGFDMIELQAAHGGLIASFISPLTNRRTDDYGGSIDKRMQYPLAVVAEMRAVWPAEKPMAVRISASDWLVDDGLSEADSVRVAALLKGAGVDLVDVSSGETTSASAPTYGRLYQVPLSDRLRNEACVKTMTAGNIYEADQINSILMAGRADLVALGRPLMADPYWLNRAAAQMGDSKQLWPKPYELGKAQLCRLHQASFSRYNGGQTDANR